MTPQSIASQLLADTRFLHVSGISQAISPSARSTVRHAIESGRAAGASISYDPNLRLRLWPIEVARAAIIETMALSDVFLPSLDDLQTISGLLAPADIVDWCHLMGAPWVVLKLGAQGCLVSDGTRQSAIPAFLVDAVDATGAGDCFDGSLLGRLAAGDDLLTAARWASAAAAIATTGYGAVKPLPSFAEVARLTAAGSGH
jgi:2-dehydro-3-deoxygluconokinase